MADTDTGSLCAIVEGDGCAWRERPPPEDCLDEGGSGYEPSDIELAVVEGDGCGCVSGPLPAPALVLALLFALLRRRALLLVLLLVAGPARAADAQALQPLDGGDLLGLQEPEVGPPWTPHVGLTLSRAANPVMLRMKDTRIALVDEIQTVELHASLALAGLARVGVSLPWHEVESAHLPSGQTRGDRTVWARVAVLERKRLAVSGGLQSDLGTGDPERFVGDRNAVRGSVAFGWRFAHTAIVSNVGLRLKQQETLPGLTWGSRFDYGLGVRGAPWPWLDGSAEVFGSLPAVGRLGNTSAWPLELLGTVRVRPVPALAFRAGGGLGLTRGLGSPRWRMVLATEIRGRQPQDTDGDGYADLRDLCPKRPEDRDGFRDADGCPDTDNDQDGFLDPDDRCPDRAEVFNGILDEDGCPDAPGFLELTVRSATGGELRQARMRVDGAEVALLSGEPVEQPLPPGRHVLVVTAADHHGERVVIDLAAGVRQRVSVALQPIAWGGLRIRLVDPQGAPLAGQWREAGGEWADVPAEGLDATVESGSRIVEAAAADHVPRSVDVEVPPANRLELTLVLEPAAVRLDGDRLQLADEVRFALDSADLSPLSAGLLDALAAWLHDHPEIELLRVEGHADGTGSSRYNFALSQRRAEAVVDALVRRGVAAERLQAMGSGEALIRDRNDASRRVGFLVLVWDDLPAVP